MKIGVLWSVLTTSGKKSNAGNYLICERGKKLLEKYCDKVFQFDYIERTKPFNASYDGLIILGGPIISRKIHHQSKIIIESIKDKKTPIFCLGIGISGSKFDTEKKYFIDDASIHFWKDVYQSSKLFSVRDKITQDVLQKYDINADLTGCPALFNLKHLDENSVDRNNKSVKKIAISIPQFRVSTSIKGNLSIIKPFFVTIYLLYALKKEFREKELGVVFQHGSDNLFIKLIQKYGNWIGLKTYDYLGKSLDSYELNQYDVQIGTRLHSHINYLSMNKPSFLFNINMRTEAFLETINTPSEKYTFTGVNNLIKKCSESISYNNFDEFNDVLKEISKYFRVMGEFINKIIVFYN